MDRKNVLGRQFLKHKYDVSEGETYYGKRILYNKQCKGSHNINSNLCQAARERRQVRLRTHQIVRILVEIWYRWRGGKSGLKL